MTDAQYKPELMLNQATQNSLNDQLPPNRAFVVQFASQTDFAHNTIVGRAEHIASGAVVHFESPEELLEFAAKLLSAQA